MQKFPVRVLAHNIRSLWNVGAFFRTADAFGVEHIYLTGYTPAPPRREISTTALGAETWIPWSQEVDSLKVIESCKKEGFVIAALEKTNGSTLITKFVQTKPLLLIVGHEVTGVPLEILELSDVILEIPMQGKKESLNVSVALGVGLYALKRNTCDAT